MTFQFDNMNVSLPAPLTLQRTYSMVLDGVWSESGNYFLPNGSFQWIQYHQLFDQEGRCMYDVRNVSQEHISGEGDSKDCVIVG